MPRPAGWVILGQIGLEIAALNLMLRATEASRREPTPKPHKETIPSFITEITDSNARRYRLRTSSGPLYAGFYSDGRVRMATPAGQRFSGVAVEDKAIVAALRDDVSFEMEMRTADPMPSVKISGGPYDGQTLPCEALA
ncbi:MAG: hypothetical protein JO233_07025 [Candidatus Eremiobacteraeota bacterium]|nr:hypothetical protein [Candidatus Eremiobacteraeota bacterium]